MALGRSPDLAINHNAAALALHAANHPDTLHVSENIYQVDPLDYVKGRHVGLAHFSPDCKHFSKAKGGKPVERNIRDLAWIVVLWAERAQPDVITMENVEEWQDWGPLIETDKGLVPDPDRKGETYQKWCKAMRKFGYKLQKRELRACDYGAPTIRKRLFVIARRDGLPIVWPEPTHSKPTDPDVISGKKLPWRTAAECIDWSISCPSIFDTGPEIMQKHAVRAVRPLAKATMARVARGMKRYVLDADRPFIVNLTHGGRLEDVDQPFNTITGANRGEKAVVAPVLTAAQHGGSVRSVEDPHHTITASKKDQNSVIVPTLVGCGGRAGQSRPRDGDEPMATITAKADSCVAVAYMAQHNNDRRREGGVNPGRDMAEPLSTVTQTGSQQGLVSAFVARQFGTSTGHAIDQPSATVMADGAGKSQLVTPYLQKYYGTGDGARLDEPHHTVTTKDRFGHVQAEIAVPPFTDDQVIRARQVADFMRAHGFWDEREFVTVVTGGNTFVIVDICMRMLTPRELYNAQGFPPDYIIDGAWDYQGGAGPTWVDFSKSVQVSCVGNSVSPPPYEAIIAANCGHFAVKRVAA